MTKQSSRRALTPVYGVIVFVLLYIMASTLYPGGNQADIHAAGFSWRNNYWCNLLNDTAMNGKANTAKPVALIAMIALCTALASFWYLLAVALPFSPLHKKILLSSGMSSAIAGIFIFTPYHDMFINISGAMAIAAFVLLIMALYKNSWLALFYTGLFNIGLILLNNYIYYTKNGLAHLPLVQKITFILFLGWISAITWQLYKLVQKDGQKAKKRL